MKRYDTESCHEQVAIPTELPVRSARLSGRSLARSWLAILTAAGTALGFGTQAAQVTGRPQTNCPVLGGKIDTHAYADYQGKRVYFCCGGCTQPFLANAAELIKKMEAAGTVLAPAPANPGAAQGEAAPSQGCCAKPAGADEKACPMEKESPPETACPYLQTTDKHEATDADRQKLIDYIHSLSRKPAPATPPAKPPPVSP